MRTSENWSMKTMLERTTQSPRQSCPGIVTESASGLDPDRILVFGDALFTPEAPLAQSARDMAEAVAATTGRGADVTAVPWSSWSGQTLVAAAGATNVANYDAVVVTVSGSVLHHRTSASAVRSAAEHVLTLVDRLRARTAATAAFIVALTYPEAPSDLASALQDARPDLIVLTSNDDTPLVPPFLLEVTQLLLDQQRARAASPQWLRSAPQPFQQRYDAIRRLGIVDADNDPDLDRIAKHMKRLFGTQGAAITFLPEGRQWSASSEWLPRGTGALNDSFCRTTVLGSGPLVVGDAWQGHHLVPRNDVRFYAGYPLETPDGTRMGAVCVFDPHPRDERSVELDLLRDFAILVRSTLYRE